MPRRFANSHPGEPDLLIGEPHAPPFLELDKNDFIEGVS